MRYCLLLIFLISNLVIRAQTPYLFSLSDSIVVRFNADTLEMPWAGGINYAQFSNIDLNDDGVKDLFVFDRTGNKALCFVHDAVPGSDGYRHAPEFEMAFPPMINWAMLYDFNCDGKEDIWTYTPGGIKVFMNTSTPGNLSFVLHTPLIKSQQFGNYVNLYVSSVDLAGVADIDGDSDLDVLTFGVFGTTLEYHRNYSVENGFGCDSLQFAMMNTCWGCFGEDQFANSIILNDTCDNTGISNPEFIKLIEEATQRDREWTDDPSRSVLRHSGSCTCAMDIDGDKMTDLLLGDVSFPNLVQVTNGGTIPNTNQCMDDFDTLFPSYDSPVNLELFPCAFYVETNNDGKKDLIVTPQSTGSSENLKSVMLYRNSQHDTLPYFNYVQRDFLQKEMIEMGEGAIPVFADYNSDGLQDLFVSSYGYYNSVSDSVICKLSLYVNSGTASSPEFNLLTDNFESLNLVINRRSLVPAFGDLDNDGDDDMLVGNETGFIAYFQNIAGAGNPYDFSLVAAGIQDDMGTNIDVGQFSAPLLVDIDRDGDLDLLVGNKSGKITFYRNDGTASAYLFRFVTDYFGQLNVKEWWDNSGYSMPAIWDDNNSYQLFIGSKAGYVHHYNNIDGNLSGTFNRVDTTVFEVLTGLRTAPAVADLDNDGYMDMLLGNYRGGINLYMGDPSGSSSVEEMTDAYALQVYPNPAVQQIAVVSTVFSAGSRIRIYDLTGKEVYSAQLHSEKQWIDVSQFSPGIYVITVQDNSRIYSVKFIRHENE